MAGKKKAPEAPREGNVGPENRFSKGQLLSAGRFQERRDIVQALLKEGELYTVRDVEEKIEDYMKGKVR